MRPKGAATMSDLDIAGLMAPLGPFERPRSIAVAVSAAADYAATPAVLVLLAAGCSDPPGGDRPRAHAPMTIINHTHRFVFVHVPKNAGTSVAHYLSHCETYYRHTVDGSDTGQTTPAMNGSRFVSRNVSRISSSNVTKRRATCPNPTRSSAILTVEASVPETA